MENIALLLLPLVMQSILFAISVLLLLLRRMLWRLLVFCCIHSWFYGSLLLPLLVSLLSHFHNLLREP